SLQERPPFADQDGASRIGRSADAYCHDRRIVGRAGVANPPVPYRFLRFRFTARIASGKYQCKRGRSGQYPLHSSPYSGAAAESDIRKYRSSMAWLRPRPGTMANAFKVVVTLSMM